MSKLEAKAQEIEDESGDPTCRNYQDTRIDQNTGMGYRDAEVSNENQQKTSCVFKSGIERWGTKTGGRKWAENY